jgi:hypothetical protein
MSNKISFYIQAKETDGLGHLKRSIGLIKNFQKHGYIVNVLGDFSTQAKKVLASVGLGSARQKSWSRVVIIDATEISIDIKNQLESYDLRLLISPIFNDFQFATHVFSRTEVPRKHKFALENQKVIYDPLFSFTTISNLIRKKSINAQNLKVGICVSGSATYVNLADLLKVCTNSKNVSSVTVLGDLLPSETVINGKLVATGKFVDNLWEHFFDIDFFITGDGLMIFEAMAQAIPTLSLCRAESWNKNAHFYEKNWCSAVNLIDFDSEKIANVLSDSKMLREQGKRLFDANFGTQKDALFNSLLKIIRELR